MYNVRTKLLSVNLHYTPRYVVIKWFAPMPRRRAFAEMALISQKSQCDFLNIISQNWKTISKGFLELGDEVECEKYSRESFLGTTASKLESDNMPVFRVKS